MVRVRPTDCPGLLAAGREGRVSWTLQLAGRRTWWKERSTAAPRSISDGQDGAPDLPHKKPTETLAERVLVPAAPGQR